MSEKQVNESVESETASTQPQEEESWFDLIKTFFYAGLIALVFRSFIFQPFTIPSESMLKNLMVGDFLLVSKYTYGYSRHSLPFSLPIIPGRIFASPVERGDVVVFRLPRDPSTYYIKRIIGTPGDKIQMRNGALYLNDEKVPTEKLADYVRINTLDREERFGQFRETMPNGRSYETLDIEHRPRADDTDAFIVPEGHYFALGDNRDNSQDSRWSRNIGVGYIPEENIVGEARWITLSFDNKAELWEFWKWFPGERRERFFSKIN